MPSDGVWISYRAQRRGSFRFALAGATNYGKTILNHSTMAFPSKTAEDDGVNSHQPTRLVGAVLEESSIAPRAMYFGPRLRLSSINSRQIYDCEYLLTCSISELHR